MSFFENLKTTMHYAKHSNDRFVEVDQVKMPVKTYDDDPPRKNKSQVRAEKSLFKKERMENKISSMKEKTGFMKVKKEFTQAKRELRTERVKEVKSALNMGGLFKKEEPVRVVRAKGKKYVVVQGPGQAAQQPQRPQSPFNLAPDQNSENSPWFLGNEKKDKNRKESPFFLGNR